MLTRLKVTGFKNLVDVDVRFGPFTCIAGANGVGKSNLFDAIQFLSLLSDLTLVDAASRIRGGQAGDIRNLFHRAGERYSNEMTFEAEMIIPVEGVDDLGQAAKATSTFLRYSLTVAYRAGDSMRSSDTLEIVKEELQRIKKSSIKSGLLFNMTESWRNSAVRIGQRNPPFISTAEDKGQVVIKRHQDGVRGRPFPFIAANLPRTVLSVTTASENPTALLARREMQSWRQLQLEPSALRRSDDFIAQTKLGIDGSHLPATLYRLAQGNHDKGTGLNSNGTNGKPARQYDGKQIYSQVANRLSELIENVSEVRIDRDEKRRLLTLQLTDRSQTTYPAQALSDGTLRFLALTVLELDSESQGVICLEEPENGIHPARIPAILSLLKDIATDTAESLDIDNPLRQVIINTHSPAVALQVPPESLLVAELKETIDTSKRRFKRITFSCMKNTWRLNAREKPTVISKGDMLVYLNPVPPKEDVGSEEPEAVDGIASPKRRKPRVIDALTTPDLFSPHHHGQ